jgi:hypothetical protein
MTNFMVLKNNLRMETCDLWRDCWPDHSGESAIDERGSGNKPPKGEEVRR